MEQEVVIKVPDGKIAVQSTNEEGNIIVTFKDKEPVRSRSWEKFCENHPNVKGEWYIQNNSAITIWGYTTNERRDIHRNNLETKEDAEAILALIQLKRLHDEWVGDWQLLTKKDYYAIKYDFACEKPLVGKWWNTQHFLSFPVREMAEEFLEYFRDLIEKAKKFI